MAKIKAEFTVYDTEEQKKKEEAKHGAEYLLIAWVWVAAIVIGFLILAGLFKSDADGRTPELEGGLARLLQNAPQSLPEARRSTFHPSGSYLAQIASMSSHAQAEREWVRLRVRAPELLRGANLRIDDHMVGNRLWWRVQVGYFRERSDVRTFCNRAQAQGVPCLPVER